MKLKLLLIIALSFILSACAEADLQEAETLLENPLEISEEPVDKLDIFIPEVTEEQAIEIVKEIAEKITPTFATLYYNTEVQTVDYVDYIVVQIYEIWTAPNETIGMTNTHNWYYINKITSEIYTLDLSTNELISVE